MQYFIDLDDTRIFWPTWVDLSVRITNDDPVAERVLKKLMARRNAQ
uniref:Uncharacterized protein n=1 Tax=Yoonia rhodophyticola TaxID=3137370 RepID=A0AAN0NKD1_9RHOB